MKVYNVRHKTLKSNLCWVDFLDAVEEVNMHLSEGNVGDIIEIEIRDVSMEEYKKLPEFGGY